jgi:hypothetical protein
MHTNVHTAQQQNNEHWKINGERVFGRAFKTLSHMCMQAGYNPATMSGFYMNINKILSGKYIEEIELDAPMVGRRKIHVIKSIDESMGRLTLGRSRDNDLCTLSDSQTSKQHAMIYKDFGKLIYHNLSKNNDGWKMVDMEGKSFMKVPRVTGTELSHQTELHLGDYVILARNSLSVLRVNLSSLDVKRLMDLMHATRCIDDPENGPPNAEEAVCQMQIKRAQVHQRAHHNHACVQMNMAILQGAAAVNHLKEELHVYRHQLEDKVYDMDHQVGVLKQKLKQMVEIRELDERRHRLSTSGMPLQHVRQCAAASQPSPAIAVLPHSEKFNKRAAPQHPYRDETHRHPHQCTSAQSHQPEKYQRVQTQRELDLELLVSQAEAKLHEQTQLLQAANLQVEQALQENQCVICFEPKLTKYAFIPCGHMCCCFECVLKTIGGPCPLCRANVIQSVQVFG